MVEQPVNRFGISFGPGQKFSERSYAILFAVLSLVAVYLLLRRIDLLFDVLATRRAGTPETYPHQYEILLLGFANGILWTFLLPYPIAIGWIEGYHRKWLPLAIGLWVVLMGASLYLSNEQRQLLGMP